MTTEITSVQLVNSTVDNSPVGATTPAAGAFSALTAPTVAESDSSTNAATTAWVRGLFPLLASSDGYIKLPGGLIIQWGITADPDNNDLTITWPITFPTQCFVALFTAIRTTNNRVVNVLSISTTGAVIVNDGTSGGNYFVAIGN